MLSHDEEITADEFGLACEVLDLLARVPLNRRREVLNMATTLVANEEERHCQSVASKLMAKLARYGCQIRQLPREM